MAQSLRTMIRMKDDEILDKLESHLGEKLARKPKPKPILYGYQKRDVSYPVPVSNRIPSPQPFTRAIYNRMGAVIPPVPVPPRTSDNHVIKDVPCASRVSSVNNITSKHDVFYDDTTGEIVLVVIRGSNAEHFYTRYYEGTTTFPHIRKMRGDDMRTIVRSDIPPIMLVVDGEPVYWGYSGGLKKKIKHDKELDLRIKNAKSCWLQLQPPMIIEPRVRPVFDMPRLRFVLSLMSQIKST